MPQSLDLEEHQISYLSTAPYEILRKICVDICEPSADKNAKEDMKYRHPLNGFSSLSRNIRNISAPILFQKVAVRGDWKKADQRLMEMEDFPAVFEHIRLFKFELSIWNRQEFPPITLAPRLASQLGRMKNLEKLIFVIPEERWHVEAFESELAQSNVTLPKVHTVIVGPFCDFAIRLCPNVKTVANNGRFWLDSKRGIRSGNNEHLINLIQAASTAAKITNLEIRERWLSHFLEKIAVALPDLRSLSLDGSMSDALSRFLPALGKFKSLQTLAIPHAAELGVGFDPPECGNAYWDDDGNEDTAFAMQIADEEIEAEATVAEMVGPVCRNLTQLWIGDSTKQVIFRDDNGTYEGVIWHRGKQRDTAITTSLF